MRAYILLLLFALGFSGCDLLASLGGSTSVEGVAVDETTGEPIAGVGAYLVNGCGFGLCTIYDQTITDDDGRFHLESSSRSFERSWPAVHVNTCDGLIFQDSACAVVSNRAYGSYYSTGYGIEIEPGERTLLIVELCRLNDRGQCAE